ncbi:MAG: hypothetical protein FJW23_05950 [Acidimicrobiia bacterium]|nr:hypothetical protein [Acidimicrobiia bacterium]
MAGGYLIGDVGRTPEPAAAGGPVPAASTDLLVPETPAPAAPAPASAATTPADPPLTPRRAAPAPAAAARVVLPRSAAGLPTEAPSPEPLPPPTPVLEARAATDAGIATPIAAPKPTPGALEFGALVLAADSVIGLEIEAGVTSESAQPEDRVTARVTRDVRAGDTIVIPAGARAVGEVAFVERGGRLRERARLGVRFTTIMLASGVLVPIESDTIVREGDSPAAESTAKIGGGALGGAIIGGLLGGRRGAVIGGSAGAGAGSAAVLAGGRNPATLPAGSLVTVRLTEEAIVDVEP